MVLCNWKCYHNKMQSKSDWNSKVKNEKEKDMEYGTKSCISKE